jgi:shikimate kinase
MVPSNSIDIDTVLIEILQQMYLRSLFSGKNLFFVNFKYNVEFFQKFEDKLKSIDLILLQSMSSQVEFQERYLTITDYIGTKQTCILSDDSNDNKITHLLSKNFNYGLLVGCKLSGKKTILKELKKKLKFEVISVNKIIAKIKEKLAEEGVEEEEEIEEIELENNSQTLLEEEKEFLINEMRQKKLIQKNFKNFQNALLKIKTYMEIHSEREYIIEVDPSEMPEEYFNFIRECLSTPRFIIFINISIENYLARYKIENNLDDINEEEMPVIEDYYKGFKKLNEFFIQQCQRIDFLNFIEFNNNIPLESAKENIVNIFEKDLIFLVDRVNGNQEQSKSIEEDCRSKGKVCLHNLINSKDQKIRQQLKLNCIRNEIGWIDLNECQEVQFKTQKDLNKIIKKKLQSIRENSSIYFVYYRTTNKLNKSIFK